MGVDDVQVLGMLVGRLPFDLEELAFGFVDGRQESGNLVIDLGGENAPLDAAHPCTVEQVASGNGDPRRSADTDQDSVLSNLSVRRNRH